MELHLRQWQPQLALALQEQWATIPQGVICNPIDSMAKRSYKLIRYQLTSTQTPLAGDDLDLGLVTCSFSNSEWSQLWATIKCWHSMMCQPKIKVTFSISPKYSFPKTFFLFFKLPKLSLTGCEDITSNNVSYASSQVLWVWASVGLMSVTSKVGIITTVPIWHPTSTMRVYGKQYLLQYNWERPTYFMITYKLNFPLSSCIKSIAIYGQSCGQLILKWKKENQKNIQSLRRRDPSKIRRRTLTFNLWTSPRKNRNRADDEKSFWTSSNNECASSTPENTI